MILDAFATGLPDDEEDARPSVLIHDEPNARSSATLPCDICSLRAPGFPCVPTLSFPGVLRSHSAAPLR